MAEQVLQPIIQSALVGAGRWGTHLARNLHALGALGAVCDADPHTANILATTHGVPVLDWQQVLEQPGIGAVVLASPAVMHDDMACSALQAGKHVYIEKPMALTQAQAQRILSQAQQADRVVMVGHLLHYHAAFAQLKALVAEGKIGIPNHIHATRHAPGVVRQHESVVMDLMTHDLSMLFGVIQAPIQSMQAFASAHAHPQVVDTASARLAFKGGATAHLHASWMHPTKQHQFSVAGSQGMLLFDDVKPWEEKLCFYPHRLVTTHQTPVLQVGSPQYQPLEPAEPLKEEMVHFIHCASQGMQPLTNAQEGLRVIDTAEQLEALCKRPLITTT